MFREQQTTWSSSLKNNTIVNVGYFSYPVTLAMTTNHQDSSSDDLYRASHHWPEIDSKVNRVKHESMTIHVDNREQPWLLNCLDSCHIDRLIVHRLGWFGINSSHASRLLVGTLAASLHLIHEWPEHEGRCQVTPMIAKIGLWEDSNRCKVAIQNHDRVYRVELPCLSKTACPKMLEIWPFG